jgi:hypothetical protein
LRCKLLQTPRELRVGRQRRLHGNDDVTRKVSDRRDLRM